MNIANALSLFRVLALPAIALLSFGNTAAWGWAAFGLFVCAALTDALDGWAARKFNCVSTLGKFLDALVDKVFVIGLLVVLLTTNSELRNGAVLIGTLLILTREFFITGLRILAAAKGVVLAAESAGKWKTAFQMTSLGLYFLSVPLERSILPDFAAMAVTAAHFALTIAVIQTALSGIGYFRQYGNLLTEDT